MNGRTCARTALVIGGLGLAACAGRARPGEVQPGVAENALAETRLSGPALLVFDWRLRDGQARFSGSGAARVAPDRARLDLFGPQDVLYLSALLRDDQLETPQGVPAELVPPAPLLWSVLGVVRPPQGAQLLTAVSRPDQTVLVYGDRGGDWRYVLNGEKLRRVEWLTAAGARHTVELEPGDLAPRKSVYRDWQEYRELVLELKREEAVDSFPPEVWTLP